MYHAHKYTLFFASLNLSYRKNRPSSVKRLWKLSTASKLLSTKPLRLTKLFAFQLSIRTKNRIVLNKIEIHYRFWPDLVTMSVKTQRRSTGGLEFPEQCRNSVKNYCKKVSSFAQLTLILRLISCRGQKSRRFQIYIKFTVTSHVNRVIFAEKGASKFWISCPW